MPKFAANLSFLYAEHPFLSRFGAAAASGFGGVEFHFPYAHAPDAVARAAQDAGTEVVLFNLPAGDWEAGERGIACHPARMVEFRAGVDQAIGYARELSCKRVNCLAGVRPMDVPRDMARATLISNLRYAADSLASQGMKLMLEPINTRDIPGFFISRSYQVAELIDVVGADNFFLQYDLYHAQIMEGDLARNIEENFAKLGHVQIADNPGRHQPGTGEIRFEFLFEHLDRLGYEGWIGCEYLPLGTSEASLDWFRAIA